VNLAHALLLACGIAAGSAMRAQAQATADTTQHEIFGRIDSIAGSRLVLRTRTGRRVDVDALPALTASRSAVLFVGRVIDVVGTLDAAGVFHAKTIARANNAQHPELWPPDR
jgi:hypothetical protein